MVFMERILTNLTRVTVISVLSGFFIAKKSAKFKIFFLFSLIFKQNMHESIIKIVLLWSNKNNSA